MKDDIDKWIDIVKSICLLAGDWMGYEDSQDPDIVAKQQDVFRSVAVALREKALTRIEKQDNDSATWKQRIKWILLAFFMGLIAGILYSFIFVSFIWR